jgi:Zn-dependent protease
MKMNFVLTRIWGIPIGLHFSWLIIFGLLMFSLATGLLPAGLPGLPVFVITLLALATSLMFFGSVLAHELGHAFVALRERIPVRGISLFIFGGVAQIDKEPESAGAEFRIAAAGPLVSFILAGLFFALSQLPVPELITFPASWLARINLILAVFNLIPGFPLDGGRIFRAIVWKVSGDAYRATRIAAFGGQAIAAGFIGLGIWLGFTSGLANGLWMAFIGWFLLSAASGSMAYATFQKSMDGLNVAQVMRREVPTVPPFLSLKSLVQQYVLGLGHQVMLVGDGYAPQGVISLDKITAVGQSRWALMTTEQAMTPLEGLESVDPQTDLVTALRLMETQQLDLLPVMEADRVSGVVTREDIMKAVEVRRRLKL